MTFTTNITNSDDPLSMFSGQEVDEIAAANGIGQLLAHLKGSVNTKNVNPLQNDPGTVGVGPLAPKTSYTQSSDVTTPITDPTVDTNTSALAAQPTTPAPTNYATTGTAYPIPGGSTVNSPYGQDRGQGHIHAGVDLKAAPGTTLVAAINGKITHVGNDDPGGFGRWIEITGANGLSVRYGHLSEADVQLNQEVQAGQLIAKSGGIKGADGSGDADGPHLHFEVRQDGKAIDPMPFLAGASSDQKAVPAGATATPDETTTITRPSRSIAPQDAVDTGLERLTGSLADTGDPGSQNLVTKQTETRVKPGQPLPGGTGAVSKGDGDVGSVDSFLAAIRQHESGGNYSIRNTSGLSNAAGAYQFIGSTWRGLGGSTASAADASPAEQDRIARAYALSLFNKYHSWRLAAIAWYQPSAADAVARGEDPGAPAGQGRFIDYGDTIARMMAGG